MVKTVAESGAFPVSNSRNLHKQFLVAAAGVARTPQWAAATPNNCADVLPLVADVGDKCLDVECQDGTRVTTFRYETGTSVAPWDGPG
jgi:hypothetical protein